MRRRLKISTRRGWRNFRRRVFSGLLVLVPLGITLLLVQFVYGLLAGLLVTPLELIFRQAPQAVLVPLAFGALLFLLWGVGMLTSYVVGKRMISLGEWFISSVPVVASVYSATKQVIQIVMARDTAAFKAVVLVPYPYPPLRSLGFVTGTIRDPDGSLLYKVFVPTTPNPTSGFLHFVPVGQADRLDLTVEEAIRMIVSAGVLSGETLPYRHEQPRD